MENVYPFSKINMVPGKQIGDSPARCNRRTKELWLNADLWPTLSENTKDFIIYHEAGHIILQTTNEIAADEYAFQRMIKEGKSMRDCVLALTSLLTDSPGHRQRAYITLQRGKVVDELAATIKAMESHYSNFSIGSRAKKNARKANKIDKKNDKIERRAIRREKKRAKIEGKRSRYKRGEMRSEATLVKAEGKADSQNTLAEMGITQGTEAGGILKGAAGLFAKQEPLPASEPQVLQAAMAAASQPNSMAEQSSGGVYKASNEMQNQFTPDREDNERTVTKNMRESAARMEDGRFAPEPPKKKNNMIYIIGGIVVVLIVSAVLIFKSKK